MDLERIRELLDEALSAAHTEGMEEASEMEGCSWTGKGLEDARQKSEAARKTLEEALGLPKVVPVHDGVGGPTIGSATLNEDGTATISLLDSPEAKRILDKLKGPQFGIGISSKGGDEPT